GTGPGTALARAPRPTRTPRRTRGRRPPRPPVPRSPPTRAPRPPARRAGRSRRRRRSRRHAGSGSERGETPGPAPGAWTPLPSPTGPSCDSPAPGEGKDALRDDLPEDLRGSALDRVPSAAKLESLPQAVLDRVLAAGEHRGRTLDLQGELGEPLVRVGPHELHDRALGTRHARGHQRRQSPVVGEPEGLEHRPQLGDPIAHERVVGRTTSAASSGPCQV